MQEQRPQQEGPPRLEPNRESNQRRSFRDFLINLLQRPVNSDNLDVELGNNEVMEPDQDFRDNQLPLQNTDEKVFIKNSALSLNGKVRK